MSKAVSSELTFVEHAGGCGCRPTPSQPEQSASTPGAAVSSGYETVDKSGRCGCCSSYYRSVWDRLCQQLFGYIPAGMDTEQILRGLVIWKDDVVLVDETIPATFRVTATGERKPMVTDIIYYKEHFYNIGGVSAGASDVYTCTECLPIEASVIEVYKTLVATNARLDNNEIVRRDRANQDHDRAEADHGVAVSDHQQYGDDHFTARQDHAGYEADHDRAASDHLEASGDRSRAADDHARADADHSTAQEDHARSDNDHTRAESDHTRAEQDHQTVSKAVLFTPQTLTEEEQAQARENIGVEGTGTDTEAVHYTPQTLTDAQKSQARTNIGATAPELFWAVYGTTTAQEVRDAVAAGKVCLCKYEGRVYTFCGDLVAAVSYNWLWFMSMQNDQNHYVRVGTHNNGWQHSYVNLEHLDRKKATIAGNESSDTYYPSTKAVADAIAAGKQIFWAVYGETTVEELDAAIAANKVVFLVRNSYVYRHIKTENDFYCFAATYAGRTYNAKCNRNNGAWTAPADFVLENTANKSQSVDTDKASTTKYPSVKAVYDKLKMRPIMDSEDETTIDPLNLESANNKVQSLAGNEANENKYPSTKALAAALGKWGVVSQTQTWTGDANTGYDYTMSNQVYGLIPKANLDLFENAGAVFNESTGYFELNGLTDVSYEEMTEIYKHYSPVNMTLLYQDYTALRTVIPNSGRYYQANYNSMFADCRALEVTPRDKYRYYPNGGTYQMFIRCDKLKTIGNCIYRSSNNNGIFNGCSSLENVEIQGLLSNISIADSPRLTLASVVYAVRQAANTAAITITLHATAYARCQADTTEYTYNGQTYTGILAYASAKNITLASAN